GQAARGPTGPPTSDRSTIGAGAAGLLGEVDYGRGLTAVEVVVRAVGPNHVGSAARVDLHLDEVEQAAIPTGGARDSELADRPVMGRVLAHLGRSKAGARVRLPVRDRIQRLRHVHVPGALDEAGTARLVRARAERGSPVPDDVHASRGA